MNIYGMIKGTLINGAPFSPDYQGSPHYVITISPDGGTTTYTIVVNAASTEIGEDGDADVYTLTDFNFTDPITAKLPSIALGSHTSGFPPLDYWQDSSMVDISRMRPIPCAGDDRNRADVNDTINQLLTINTTQAAQSLPFDNGSGNPESRDFYTPTNANVTVYGFGFLFPNGDGLHETHMNQGNPQGKHWKENGAFQDGALIVQIGNDFSALFTAFQTQLLPTDTQGDPVRGAVALPDYIRSRAGGNR